MDDRVKAQDVEIVVDNTGKLWVNIDGKCVLRVGECGQVTMDDPIRGMSMVYIGGSEG